MEYLRAMAIAQKVNAMRRTMSAACSPSIEPTTGTHCVGATFYLNSNAQRTRANCSSRSNRAAWASTYRPHIGQLIPEWLASPAHGDIIPYCPPERRSMRPLFVLVAWFLLLVLCWPVAILALVLWPLIWLIS